MQNKEGFSVQSSGGCTNCSVEARCPVLGVIIHFMYMNFIHVYSIYFKGACVLQGTVLSCSKILIAKFSTTQEMCYHIK